MKTTTILSAYILAMKHWLSDDLPNSKHWKYGAQTEIFSDALIRRIEAGDRARDALKRVEWVNSDFDIATGEPWNNICPWCKEYQDEGHAPDCPRQIALGLEP